MKRLKRTLSKSKKKLNKSVKSVGRRIKRLFKRYILRYLPKHPFIRLLLFLSVMAVFSLITNLQAQAEANQVKAEKIQALEETLNQTHTELLQTIDSQNVTKQQLDEKVKAEEALRRELEALRAAKAKTNPRAVYAASQPVSGTCQDWIVQAGIEDVANAYALIMRESGCSPSIKNRYSGACGLPQALPCSKLPGYPGDPVAQLRWMQDYVFGRYGSWANANAFQQSHGWY